MYEVELKLRADHDEVRPRLSELGADAAGTVVQRDTYFDAPDRNFAETDEALRIRRERHEGDDEQRAAVTYKGPLLEDASKTRAEAETGVDDGEAVREILLGLGYNPAVTVPKERTRYVVDDCTVTLDTVDGLGEFVEVELETDTDLEAGPEGEECLDALRSEAAAVVERLGLDPTEQIQTSYLGLLLAEE